MGVQHSHAELRRALLWLVALFPLAAVSARSLDSVIFTLVAIAALVSGWGGWREARREERLLVLGYLALFSAAALSLLQTEDLYLGIQKLERYLRLALLGLVFLMFLRLRIAAGAHLLLGAGAAAVSLAAQAFHETAIEGNPGVVGIYHKIIFGDTAMLVALLLLSALLTVAARPWQRGLFALSAGLALYASIASATRGAWLALPAVGLLLAWIYRREIRTRLAVATGVAAVAVILLLSFVPNPVRENLDRGIRDLQTFSVRPDAQTSWGMRLNLWRNSFILWSESPFIGTGIGDFQGENRRLVEEGLSLNPHVQEFGHAHSVYFDALATMGTIGFIALTGALFLLPFSYFSRRFDPLAPPWTRFYALGGMVTVVSFAVFGLSEGWLSRNAFVNQYVFCLAVLWAGLAQCERGGMPSHEGMAAPRSQPRTVESAL